MTASISQQLLYILQLYIVGKFQLVKSHYWEKKLIYIFQGFYRFRFLLHRYIIHSLLRKAYTVLCTANRFLGSEAPKHNAFDHF